MTTQEAYEGMREWITRPGATRAANPGGACFYITDDGNKCIVGGVLTDNTLESLRDAFIGVYDLVDQYFVPELEDVDLLFLTSAQRLHDHMLSWESGIFNVRWLDKLAERHGLEVVRPLYVPREWSEEALLA